MIIPSLFTAAMICPSPKLDNKTTTWTKTDQSALLEVQKARYKEHNPKEPCLYVFIKKDDGNYTGQCGPELKRK